MIVYLDGILRVDIEDSFVSIEGEPYYYYIGVSICRGMWGYNVEYGQKSRTYHVSSDGDQSQRYQYYKNGKPIRNIESHELQKIINEKTIEYHKTIVEFNQNTRNV